MKSTNVQPGTEAAIVGNNVLAVVYSDGKDYSHLKANTDENPEHAECVYCGSNNQTITDDADICHDCGEVYT